MAQVPIQINTAVGLTPTADDCFLVDFKVSNQQPTELCEKVKFDLNVCSIEQLKGVSIRIWIHNDLNLLNNSLSDFTYVGIEPQFGYHKIYEKKVDFNEICGDFSYIKSFEGYFKILDPQFPIKQTIEVFVTPASPSNCEPVHEILKFIPDGLITWGQPNQVQYVGDHAGTNLLFDCKGRINIGRDLIRGTIVLGSDVDYCLDNKTYYMDQDATIILESPQAVLKLRAANILGCLGATWNTIESMGDEQVVYVTHNVGAFPQDPPLSYIQDAKVAFTQNGTSAIWVSNNTTIQKCGVAIQANAGSSVILENSLIKNCGIGIESAYAADLFLNNPKGVPNVFAQCTYGIKDIGTSFEVGNTTFSTIKNTAIHLNSNYSNIHDLHDISFLNCFKGIYSNRTNVEVYKNTFDDISIGVEIIDNRKSNIVDNTFTKINNTGIKLSRCYNIDSKIKHNTLIGSSSSVYGMLLSLNRNNQNTSVSDNTITGIDQNSGIHIIDRIVGKGWTFHKNTISIKKNPISALNSNYTNFTENTLTTLSGVNNSLFLEGGTGLSARCNFMYGVGGSDIGLNVNQVQSGEYACNTLNNSNEGVNFQGLANPTYLMANALGNHKVGLHLKDAGLIGQHDYRGNLWNGNGNYTNGAVADGSSSGSSLFFVYTKNIPNFLPEKIIPAKNWFFDKAPGSGQSTNTCIDIKCPNGAGANVPCVATPLDGQIADGTLKTPRFSEDGLAITRRHLYDRVIENPDCFKDEPSIIKFQAENENTAIGKLHEVRKMLAAQNNVSEQLMLNEITLNEAIYAKEKSLNSIKRQILNGEIVSSNVIDAQKKVLVSEIAASKKQLKGLVVQSDTHKNNTLLEAAALNSSFSVDNQVVLNEWTINNIYIETLNDDFEAYSYEQRSALAHIANQCPFKGGQSVYEARAMYERAVPNKIYNDEQICKDAEGVSNRNGAEANAAFSIYPNPATDQVILQLNHDEVGQKTIRIIDTFGRILSATTLPENVHLFSFSVSDFAAGAYIVSIETADKKIINNKLFVTK